VYIRRAVFYLVINGFGCTRVPITVIYYLVIQPLYFTYTQTLLIRAVNLHWLYLACMLFCELGFYSIMYGTKTHGCVCSEFLDVKVLTYAAWGVGWCLVTTVLWVLLPLAAYGTVALPWCHHLVGYVVALYF